jgi:DNA invertase Pin-like site-specific DNA recombinase
MGAVRRDTRSKYKRLIEQAQKRRVDAAHKQDEAIQKLADLVREAKTAGVRHNDIADWLGITRDGLTKFLKRHPEDG